MIQNIHRSPYNVRCFFRWSRTSGRRLMEQLLDSRQTAAAMGNGKRERVHSQFPIKDQGKKRQAVKPHLAACNYYYLQLGHGLWSFVIFTSVISH